MLLFDEPDPLLRELPVLVVDCQSTAATPRRGSLLELGWARRDASPESRIAALPSGETLDRRVSRITGIGEDELERAIPRGAVWDAFEASFATSPRPVPTVAHFAPFEERWLRALHLERRGGRPFPLALICTHAIARRLYPALPRRSLRALAGYFGRELGPLRRSADHVVATRYVWGALLDALADREGVRTLRDLSEWLRRPSPARPVEPELPMPREALAALPDRPGVYRLQRLDGSTLYIGKARSLKKRVRSHFHRRPSLPERTLEMLTQARRVAFTETETALESALLEHESIKREDPPYNVALRAAGRGVERRCWFASRDLASLSESADDAHPIGPLVHRGSIEVVRALASWLDDAHDDARGAIARALHGTAALTEGLARFDARHSARATDELLAIGRARWPLPDLDDDHDGDHDEDELVLDSPRDAFGLAGPDEVADALERQLALASHAIRQARWLTRLAESAVSWRHGERRRALVIEGGAIRSAAWIDEVAVAPWPRGWLRTPAERRAAMDLAARDRLRVLTTELRRVRAEGRDPEVRLGPSQLVRGAALDRLLARV
ncbi:MAG: GIY-YIG nuclease family protein [Sandaracinaceae bacterium]